MDDVGCEVARGTCHKDPGAFGYGRSRKTDLAWPSFGFPSAYVCSNQVAADDLMMMIILTILSAVFWHLCTSHRSISGYRLHGAHSSVSPPWYHLRAPRTLSRHVTFLTANHVTDP